jgi:hypothetical protein
MRGDSWHGYIDKRHARYLLCLQDTVNDVLSDILGKNFDAKNEIDVQIKVAEGSSEITTDVLNLLSSTVNKMTGTQVFVAIMSAIFVWGGQHFYDSYNNAKKDEMILALAKDAKTEKDRLFLSEKPIKVLYNSMVDGDTMRTGNSQVELNKSEVRKHLQSSTRSKPQISCCDGEYDLEDINFSQGEEVLFLSKDGIRFKALTTMLSDVEAKKLDDLISQKKQSEDMPFSLPLQLNVEHTSKTIRHATIIGVGEKRSNVDIKRISELIEK